LPFLVGLLLTPVSALAGTLTVSAIVVLGGGSLAVATAPILLIAGLIEGLLHAVPVTLLALPVTFAVLRHYAALTVWRLVLAGFVAGILSILLSAAVLAVAGGDLGDSGLLGSLAVQDLAAITAAGSVAGAAAGACFAHLTRWLRPQSWRAPPISSGP
jgi:hypothetical protein